MVLRHMHTKQRGTAGELKVAAHLASLGYFVFKELGDLSRCDLVVLTPHYKCVKIQVKSAALSKGCVNLPLKKSGPGYKFTYNAKYVDVFAVYVPQLDRVFYVNAAEALQNTTTFTLRVEKPQNGQLKSVRYADDYTQFEQALRDYTQDTPPSKPRVMR